VSLSSATVIPRFKKQERPDWKDTGRGSRRGQTRRSARDKIVGWGGRIRTFACRNQNPVP
jgi:hypothetical protein